MLWLAAAAFGDEGLKAKQQLQGSLQQSWKLGIETGTAPNFAACYESWVRIPMIARSHSDMMARSVPR